MRERERERSSGVCSRGAQGRAYREQLLLIEGSNQKQSDAYREQLLLIEGTAAIGVKLAEERVDLFHVRLVDHLPSRRSQETARRQSSCNLTAT